ncbi:ABC transporter permease [Bradyrhizobium arachidis]|uniref:ABC transporter permease n=1 Tax=Bradyrhizobium arachidis TaxID=858423 RepID=UPI00216154CE|nr:ABC transporter permease [Bradyrhizobium arachidis]UVO35659.1 ABC transporter permease [Bradyrhizobium arachidis]
MHRNAPKLLARKLVRALVTLVLMVTSVFILMRCAGDPVTVLLGPDATPDMRAAYSVELGLDRPILWQYLVYLHNIARGSLGVSYVYRQDALGVVLSHLPLTLMLTGSAFTLAAVTGIAGGIAAAVLPSSIIGRACTVASVVGLCVPSFFLAIVLMLVFSIQLNWLPTGGAESWRGLALPAVTMAAASSAVLARYTRVAVREALDSRYVLAAFARGIPFWRILIHHVLPNAAAPILTIIGLLIGGAVTGSTVVETVFSWPGIGNLFVSSVGNRDVPVVQAIVLLAGTAMIMTNLAVDVGYTWLDPRSKSSET